MHGFPCSSLGHCFGNPSEVDTDPAPSVKSNNSRHSRNNHGLPAADPVTSQPETLPGRTREYPQQRPQRTRSCVSARSTRTRKLNGTNSLGHMQDKHEDPCFETPPACRIHYESSGDDELELECSPELELKYPQIPRPSIIIRQPKVRKLSPVCSVFTDTFINN